MSKYISVDAVKGMFDVESMEDITIAYYVFLNYSYTEIAEIYQDEIDFKEQLLRKYQGCKRPCKFIEGQIEKIIDEIKPYFKELAIVKGKAREEQAEERQRKIVERYENQERKTINTNAFVCYGD